MQLSKTQQQFLALIRQQTITAMNQAIIQVAEECGISVEELSSGKVTLAQDFSEFIENREVAQENNVT